MLNKKNQSVKLWFLFFMCGYERDARTSGANIFKNPDMLARFKDILSFSTEKQEHIFFTLDSMIKAIKLEKI